MTDITPRDSDRSWSRRRFLSSGGAAQGGLWLTPFAMAHAVARSPKRSAVNDTRQPLVYARYSDLLSTLKSRGREYRVLGYAPDRSPVVAVKCGGKKQPAIFIAAGSHSTEHAGVSAAVELIDRLETEHEIWVVPTRDPIGLNGFRYVLGLSLGEEPEITSVDEAEDLLRREGEILYEEDETLLALIGEIGYATRGLYRKIEKGADCLEPLRGRRIYFPSRHPDQPAAGPLERAYTLIVTPDAEVLHLNRFHDTAWSPAEVRCTRKLMAETEPGLCFDLHEYGGDAFWLSARRQRTEAEDRLEDRMARAAVAAVAANGGRLADENYSPGSFFETMERGAFRLVAKQRGEGLNLIDFAAHEYGPGFTIETGMRQPFAERVRLQMLVVQTAVDLFEQQHK